MSCLAVLSFFYISLRRYKNAAKPSGNKGVRVGRASPTGEADS